MPVTVYWAVWLMVGPSGRRGSGTDEAGDRVGGFLQLDLCVGAAGLDRLHDTVRDVLVEQAQGDGLECLRHRRDLGEDVDAVLLLLDHPLQAAGLPLDATQPLEVVVLALVGDVGVLVVDHGSILSPHWVLSKGWFRGALRSHVTGRASACESVETTRDLDDRPRCPRRPLRSPSLPARPPRGRSSTTTR